MNDWYQIVIVIIVIAIQDFLSKRPQTYLGAILPIALIIASIYIWMTNIYEENGLALFLITIVGELFLIGIWSNGRRLLKAQTKKELEKMKSHDIN